MKDAKKTEESVKDAEEEEVKSEATTEHPSEEEESDTESSDETSSTKNETSDLPIEDIKISQPEDLEGETSISFPDTEVRLDVMSEIPKPESSAASSVKGTTSGIIIQQHKKKAPRPASTEEKVEQNPPKEKQSAPKRGQRSKLKKIKEKYKFQDEEERELRMKILASAGEAKQLKKNKNKKSKNTTVPKGDPSKNPKHSLNNLKFIPVTEENTVLISNETAVDVKLEPNEVPEGSKVEKPPTQEQDVSDEEDEETQLSDELHLLNTLTGCPVGEDTLLYAVPVCAPYNTMQGYKYKVKIIPGSSRRGKAAKTALQIFLHEKISTQREKDLLRSVKDQDISRNLPGKIKISTASYKKAK